MTDPVNPFVAAVLARFPGAVLVDRDAAEHAADAALQTQPIAVAPFGHAAEACHRRGWVVFPQEREGTRRPGKFRGHTIAYGEWARSPQTLRDVKELAFDRNLGRLNVAAVMSAQNGAFVLDIDVTDKELANRFAALALHRLGPHFRREYRQSRGKLGLIYATDAGNDPVARKRTLPVLTAEGASTGHVIEVISSGAPYTVLGRHWKTGSVFQYVGLSPLTHGPQAAARVTSAQLQAFLEEASNTIALLGKLKGYEGREATFSEGEVEGARVDESGIVVPGRASEVRDVEWGSNGKVANGREAYIRSRAFAYVLKNAGMSMTDSGRHALAGALAKECHDRFDGLGSHFTTWHGGAGDTDVLSACRARIQSAFRTASSRPDFVERVGRDETGRVSLVQRVAVAAPKAAALAWLGEDALSTVSIGAISIKDQERKRLARAIVTDQALRDREQDRVAAALREAITRFAGDTRAFQTKTADALPPVLLVKAPTGAGKTSLAVEIIAQDVERNGPCGPRIFMLPSYNNIDEVVARARAGKTAKLGAATPEYLAMANEAAKEARGRGLRVEILTGKERGGCLMSEQLKFLRAHKQPATALCYAKERLFVPNADPNAEPVYEETWCKHHPDNPDGAGACPVILARRKLVDADIVFAPTAFLTNQLPEGLKKVVSGLVVDERCCFEMLRFAAMPLAALTAGNRAAPILTAAERTAGVEAEGLVIDRDHVADVARKAMREGKDPVAVIAADEKLAESVAAAIMVCGRGRRSAGIKPNISIPELQRLFQAPERAGLAEEQRFWKIVQERLQNLRDDAELRKAVDAGLIPNEGRAWKATGERDARIQMLHAGSMWGSDEDQVRLSWRVEPVLKDVPTLLLDASADAAIVEKIWGGRPVETVEVKAYLHMRTIVSLDREWASTSLDVSCARDEEHAARIAHDVERIRRVETVIAGIHGWGRTATFSPKRVRRQIRTAHAEPENVDSGHYGAVRGLDFAKDHAAIITVGRLEFPSWIYDAIAAALGYDDPEPEVPFDAMGTGMTKDGKPLEPNQVERVLPLRDGRDLSYWVSEMPGRWGRAVQRQMREEELLQCAGRLRPVYRDGEAPTWIAISSIVPEGVIVDAVTTVDALSSLGGAAAVHEAVRRVGILDEALIRKQMPEARGGLYTALVGSGIRKGGNAASAGRGLDAYAVQLDGEDAPREVLVPASASDPVSTVVEAYDRSGRKVTSVRLVQKGATPVPSQVRAPDALDAELGTRDERRQAEDEARALAREAVPPRVEPDFNAEVFELPPEQHRPTTVYAPIGDEATLIAAGYEPSSAHALVVAEREARAARRAQRRAERNQSPAQATASHPGQAATS